MLPKICFLHTRNNLGRQENTFSMPLGEKIDDRFFNSEAKYDRSHQTGDRLSMTRSDKFKLSIDK